LDKDSFEGIIKQLPQRTDITLPIEEQLIVEHYSR
jgi:small subunit ribosomal protein S4